MDMFGVPKSINRHVLKALYYMNERGFENPELYEICELVEITTKDNGLVNDLPGIVRESLQNMAALGVIEGNGFNFSVRNKPIQDIEKTESISDVGLKRKRPASEDPLSSHELRNVPKRLNLFPNRKTEPNADQDNEGCCNEDEDKKNSAYSLKTLFEGQFGTQGFENKINNLKSQKDTSTESTGNAKETQTSEQDISIPAETKPDSKEVVTAEQKTEQYSEDVANGSSHSEPVPSVPESSSSRIV